MLIRLFRRLSRNRGGSTIIMVLLVFFVFSLLSMALLTLALTSSTAASSEIHNQQAYLTARSASNAAITALKGNPTLQGKISALTYPAAIYGSGSNTAMGSYTVKYEYTNASKTKVKITTTSNGQTVVAYVSVPVTVEKDYSNPFQNVRFISKGSPYSSPHSMLGASSTGNIVYFGRTSISKDATINGTLLEEADGTDKDHSDLYISGTLNGQSKADGDTVSTTGSLYLGIHYYDNAIRHTTKGWYDDDSPAKINVDTYVAGSLVLDDGATIGTSSTPVNIYVNKDITIYDGTVYGNIYCGGSVTVDGSNSYIKSGNGYGIIDANGSVTKSNGGKISTTATVTQNDTSMGTPCSIDFTKPDNMPTNIGYDKTTGKDDSVETVINNVSITNNNDTTGTITASGVITPNLLNYTTTNGRGGQTTHSYSSIIVNTGVNTGTYAGKPDKDKAVKLILDKGNYSSFDLGTNLLVKGDNYVYIYLTSGTNLILDSANIGMTSSYSSNSLDNSSNPVVPKILILGNDNNNDLVGNNIDFEGSSLLRAFVYTPYGSWSGNWTGNSKYTYGGFLGSAIIYDSNITITGNDATIDYIAPISNLADTPLADLASGKYSTTTGGYNAKGWSGS
jgi:hypothetical protein